MVRHEFGPFFDSESEILILGSIPSPKSREVGFYYGHPRNRFWAVLTEIYGEGLSEDIAEKKEFLRRHRIALWDVLASCEIDGASDASIREAVPNDIRLILDSAHIRRICTTGGKAYELYQKLCYPMTGRAAVKLPSTSPANCAVSFERLVEEYRKWLL